MTTARVELARKIELARELGEIRRLYPALNYSPHHTCTRGPFTGKPSGQLQFHQSAHMQRVVASGNGWGGTMALGCEVDAWMRHTNRWQITPDWPCLAVWFCKEFRQIHLLLQDMLIPACFGPTVKVDSGGFGGPKIIWPDGGTLYLCSYDRPWTHIEGIQVDLFVFDEPPLRRLWQATEERHRGSRACRYICKATQMYADNEDPWMADGIYRPWLDYHRALGMDEEQAIVAQRHPKLWVWPRGGKHDNPAVTDEQIAMHEARTYPSALERKIRMFGGFESLNDSPVFDAEALDWMESQCREPMVRGMIGVSAC